MLLQLQTIVKKLGLACLQTGKTKDKKSGLKESEKGKDKPIKHKNIPTSTSCCRLKNCNTDTESNLDKEEIAAFCQAPRSISSLSSKSTQANCKLLPGLRRSIAETVAAPVVDVRS